MAARFVDALELQIVQFKEILFYFLELLPVQFY